MLSVRTKNLSSQFVRIRVELSQPSDVPDGDGLFGGGRGKGGYGLLGSLTGGIGIQIWRGVRGRLNDVEGLACCDSMAVAMVGTVKELFSGLGLEAEFLVTKCSAEIEGYRTRTGERRGESR